MASIEKKEFMKTQKQQNLRGCFHKYLLQALKVFKVRSFLKENEPGSYHTFFFLSVFLITGLLHDAAMDVLTVR